MSVVLITGSNSGFGYEGALAFARNGDTVYASMRDPARGMPLREAAESEGLQLNIIALDVSRSDTFPAAIRSIVEESGRLDVLVNNAGVLRPGALEDISEQDLRQLMETNLFGPLLLTRAALPQMRKQRSGCIIMMSSLSGIAGLPGDAAYSASKFALEGATEALRHEVDRFGIRVALVEPGMYATGIFDAAVSGESLLPRDYPADSPYCPLIEARIRDARERMPQAPHPRSVGELYVRIAQSDGSQLRWPPGDVAVMVFETLFALDDAGRDAFLRRVSGTEWWSEGKDSAGEKPSR